MPKRPQKQPHKGKRKPPLVVCLAVWDRQWTFVDSTGHIHHPISLAQARTYAAQHRHDGIKVEAR